VRDTSGFVRCGLSFEEIVGILLQSGIFAHDIVQQFFVSAQLAFQEPNVPEVNVILKTVDIHASGKRGLKTSKKMINLIEASLVTSIDEFA